MHWSRGYCPGDWWKWEKNSKVWLFEGATFLWFSLFFLPLVPYPFLMLGVRPAFPRHPIFNNPEKVPLDFKDGWEKILEVWRTTQQIFEKDPSADFLLVWIFCALCIKKREVVLIWAHEPNLPGYRIWEKMGWEGQSYQQRGEGYLLKRSP